MLPELGHFCLILALCLAVLQAFMPRITMRRPLALGQVFFVSMSVVILAYALISDDFSVQYVAQNSNSNLPIYYKLTALWGAHEGSLLLWIMLLCVWILAVVIVSKRWPVNFATNFASNVLAVLGLINAGFLILLLKASNPFVRLITYTPLDGADLNPLLQDIGMIIHPPILYMGYVGTVVAFACAIAALLEGKLDQTWARLVQPWVLAAWAFLTLGIALGSWWAYYELGWGGWWFWDPVENASFMPWLTATALIHCLAVAAKKGRFLNLALFLAVATFALSLLGTFIVRSGLITSVHAFATDATRGLFILQFLSIVIGGAVLLYILRAAQLNLPKLPKLKFLSTDTAILANNALLLIAAATVLLGTLYPLLYETLFAQKISVGYPYFNAVFVPIILVMLMVMLPAITPNRKFLAGSIIVSIIAAVLWLALYFKLVVLNAALGLAFAAAIILNTLFAAKKLAMSIAHIGLAVTIIGISITSAYEVEKDIRMHLGDSVQIKDYTIRFKAVQNIDGANYLGYQGQFIVDKANKPLTILYPEKRLYLARELPMTETAISPGLFADIYIVLGQQLEKNVWAVRIYYKPFVRWIWLGAILMVCGALVGLARSKYANAPKKTERFAKEC